MRRNVIIPNRRRPWYQSPILAVFLTASLFWGMFVVYRIYAKHRETVLLRNQYHNELTALQKKESELDAKIKDLSTGRGMEAEVRNRYRVARPGEQLVIIVDDDNVGTQTQQKQGITWQGFRAFVGF